MNFQVFLNFNNIKVIQLSPRIAVEKESSDLHVKVISPPTLRINGKLKDMMNLFLMIQKQWLILSLLMNRRKHCRGC